MTYSEKLDNPLWHRKRLEILRRDNYTCQFCGKDDRILNVHHILYLNGKEVWDYDNKYLLTLCQEPCHLTEEKNKAADKQLVSNFVMAGLSRSQLFALSINLQQYHRGRVDSHQRFMNLLEFLS